MTFKEALENEKAHLEKYNNPKSGYNIKKLAKDIFKQESTLDQYHRLLLSAMILSKSDGGTLYVMDKNTLVICYMLNHSLELDFKVKSVEEEIKRRIPLYNEQNNEPNSHYLSVKTAIEETGVNIPNIQETEIKSGSKTFDKMYEYQTQSILTTPLIQEGSVLGVLQLINAMDESNSIIPFNEDIESTIGELAHLSVNDQEKWKSTFVWKYKHYCVVIALCLLGIIISYFLV